MSEAGHAHGLEGIASELPFGSYMIYFCHKEIARWSFIRLAQRLLVS